jgi:hypothetical protein
MLPVPERQLAVVPNEESFVMKRISHIFMMGRYVTLGLVYRRTFRFTLPQENKTI